MPFFERMEQMQAIPFWGDMITFFLVALLAVPTFWFPGGVAPPKISWWPFWGLPLSPGNFTASSTPPPTLTATPVSFSASSSAPVSLVPVPVNVFPVAELGVRGRGFASPSPRWLVLSLLRIVLPPLIFYLYGRYKQYRESGSPAPERNEKKTPPPSPAPFPTFADTMLQTDWILPLPLSYVSVTTQTTPPPTPAAPAPVPVSTYVSCAVQTSPLPSPPSSPPPQPLPAIDSDELNELRLDLGQALLRIRELEDALRGR